jgi:ferredoxin/flavodoxin---NADP+ reductase
VDHDGPTPAKFFQAQITDRVDFSAELWAIKVDPGGAFTFTAGQYATLGVETPRGLIERPYSIVSSPYEHEVEFFLELLPQGRLTPWLHRLQVGDVLSFRKVPKGRFTFEAQSDRTNHLLLCTVTAVAPFVSYARTLYKRWKNGTFKGEHKLFLLQGASRAFEFGYRTEMQRMAEEVPWLMYVPTISRPWEHADWSGETGRVDDIIRKYVDQWFLDGDNSVAYLCGHPGMIAHGKAILHRRGWRTSAMKEEAFFTTGKDVVDQRAADEGAA